MMRFFHTFLLLLTVSFQLFSQNLNLSMESCKEQEPGLLCGVFTVPENWKSPSSGNINLPIRVFQSTSDSPKGVVFWLSGGPGQTNLNYTPPASLRADYDVVAVGYRGVDGSVKLSCPELQESLKGKGKNLLSEESVKGINLAAKACAARLIAGGIDLDGFTIEQVIRDLEAARTAMGYNKINLLAGSYGTRISQIYMQKHPEAINRAILVGTGVPGGFVWKEEVINGQLYDLNKFCLEDPYCHQKTDDLPLLMDKVLEQAPGNWLVLGIDKGKVRAATFGMLYHRETARQAIDAYLAAAEGDYSGLAMMSLAYNFTVPKMMVWGDFMAKGMIDYEPGVDCFHQKEVNKRTAFGSPFSALFMDAGVVWPTRQPIFDESGMIAHEILLLNGSLDFSTPLSRIENELMPRLPGATLVRFEGLGHVADILFRKDVKNGLSEFYNTGLTSLNPAAVKFDFDVQMGLPRIAKISLASVLIVLLILAYGTYRVVKRIRRKSALKQDV